MTPIYEALAGKAEQAAVRDLKGDQTADRSAAPAKVSCRNVERDCEVVQSLQELGWRVLTVWECETKEVTALAGRLVEFLGSPR